MAATSNPTISGPSPDTKKWQTTPSQSKGVPPAGSDPTASTLTSSSALKEGNSRTLVLRVVRPLPESSASPITVEKNMQTSSLLPTPLQSPGMPRSGKTESKPSIGVSPLKARYTACCLCTAKLETITGIPVFCQRCVEHSMAESRAEVESLKRELEFMRQAMEGRANDENVAKRMKFLSTWDPDYQDLHSDVKLIPYEGDGVPALKCILAGKSREFKKLFRRPAIVAHEVDMPQQVLEAFVKFFYTGTIEGDMLKKHVTDLLKGADKYGVEYLKTVCENYVKENLVEDKAIWAMNVALKSNSKVIRDASLDIILPRLHKLPTFSDYSIYVENDPKLLLYLYHQAALRHASSRKRPRPIENGDRDALEDDSSSEDGSISLPVQESRAEAGETDEDTDCTPLHLDSS